MSNEHGPQCVVTEGREWPCARCDGQVEPELVAVYPDSRICLECMDATARRRLEEDLYSAQEVNRSMLPRVMTRSDDWEIGLHYRSSRILSGDFYDFFIHGGSSRLSITVGDVAGKGIPAGLLRTSLQATLRALREETSRPAELLGSANRHFLSFSQPNRFASVFHAVVDCRRDSLLYANGGHLPPLLKKAAGEWETLDASGPVLGIFDDVIYEDRFRRFEPGDLLILYTDGVTEARDGTGTFFEEQGIRRSVEGVNGMPAQQIAQRIAEALDRFSPGPPDDDRTLLIVRRL